MLIEMPKKKSRKSKKPAKPSNSLADLTGNIQFPLAASSPQESQTVSTVTPEMIHENALSLIKSYRLEMEKTLEERKSKLLKTWKIQLATYKDILKEPATPTKYEEMRKVFSKGPAVLDGSKKGKEKFQSEIPLSAIPEETDSLGEGDADLNVISDEQAGCSKDVHGPTCADKKQKKLKIISDKSDDEDSDFVFKKPAARGKKTTLKTSYRTNSFQTPGQRRNYNVAVVTPGPNSRHPVNILRTPAPGEMAISMSGSPLLIAHNNIPVHAPQISIPLSDGRVMTVLADDGLDPDMSICTDLDPETRERLVILQQLLAKKTKR